MENFVLNYQCAGCGAMLNPERNIINVTPERTYHCDGCAVLGDVPLGLEHRYCVCGHADVSHVTYPARNPCSFRGQLMHGRTEPHHCDNFVPFKDPARAS